MFSSFTKLPLSELQSSKQKWLYKSLLTSSHRSAGEFSTMSQITGGSSDPTPPIIENPNPYFSLRFNSNCLTFFSIFLTETTSSKVITTILSGGVFETFNRSTKCHNVLQTANIYQKHNVLSSICTLSPSQYLNRHALHYQLYYHVIMSIHKNILL